MMSERAMPPTLTAQIAPLLTPLSTATIIRSANILGYNQFLIRLQPPLFLIFLFGHSSKSANVREADQ